MVNGLKKLFDLLIFQRKVTYLKKTAQILRDTYEDDIPDTVENLCNLPGVGPKMAHLCMNIAWKKQSGIGKLDIELANSYIEICALVICQTTFELVCSL